MKDEINALFPDFTSKILGLEKLEVGNTKSAMREINKLQGFGVRTGLKIKGMNKW